MRSRRSARITFRNVRAIFLLDCVFLRSADGDEVISKWVMELFISFTRDAANSRSHSRSDAGRARECGMTRHCEYRSHELERGSLTLIEHCELCGCQAGLACCFLRYQAIGAMPGAVVANALDCHMKPESCAATVATLKFPQRSTVIYSSSRATKIPYARNLPGQLNQTRHILLVTTRWQRTTTPSATAIS